MWHVAGFVLCGRSGWVCVKPGDGQNGAAYASCILCGATAFLSRPAAAADAFLLKIVIEERLGWPVQLISDGVVEGIGSMLNLTGPASVYAALARGDADIYPEVCACAESLRMGSATNIGQRGRVWSARVWT